MDVNTLTQILEGHHFSMPDRIALGAWPHEPLQFTYLVQHLAKVIASREWFPKPFRAATPGEFVADVTVIERKNPRSYVVHVQRSGASGLTVAAASTHTFSTPESA
jgi:hypothetical protein